MKSTEIIVPKEQTFRLPEGRFKAKISEYKEKEKETARGPREDVVILFEVEGVPGLEDYDCYARKVLPKDFKAGSELRQYLEKLLGAGYFAAKSNQRLDPKAILEGMLCEVVLVHAKHDEERYSFPFVDAKAMYPRSPEPALLAGKIRGGKTT